MTYQPTARELDAIRAFITWCPSHRLWKSTLRFCWGSGAYPRFSISDRVTADQVAALQGLRNNHGPRWLAKFRLENNRESLET